MFTLQSHVLSDACRKTTRLLFDAVVLFILFVLRPQNFTRTGYISLNSST
jgi:hypothetical protein